MESAPCFALAPSLLSFPPPPPLAPELQPPLYQPLTPSQYVSRWRPMRDRCFNIGSALIYSSCRSAPFSSFLSSATLSRSLPASRPSAPLPCAPSLCRAKPPLFWPLSLITFYQKLILFVQFIDQPRWRRLCGAALLFLLPLPGLLCRYRVASCPVSASPPLVRSSPSLLFLLDFFSVRSLVLELPPPLVVDDAGGAVVPGCAAPPPLHTLRSFPPHSCSHYNPHPSWRNFSIFWPLSFLRALPSLCFSLGGFCTFGT